MLRWGKENQQKESPQIVEFTSEDEGLTSQGPAKAGRRGQNKESDITIPEDGVRIARGGLSQRDSERDRGEGSDLRVEGGGWVGFGGWRGRE